MDLPTAIKTISQYHQDADSHLPQELSDALYIALIVMLALQNTIQDLEK